MTGCPQCQAKTIIDPPVTIFRDFFQPQLVQIIHPIQIINRQHCIPVPHHIFTFTSKDVCTVSSKGSGKRGQMKISRKKSK